jgi:hypothetical protein
MVGEGLAIIANNPLVYAAHQSKMMFLAFALEHGQLLNLQALNPAPRLSPTAMLPVMQLPLLGLWAGASAYFRKSPHRLIVAILALALVYTLTVSIWFEFGARHRAYLLPVVLACCASLLNRRFAEPGYQRGSG